MTQALGKSRSYWIQILRLRSEALWVFVGQLGTALGVLLGVKILTHFLDPLEFGRLALANTVVILVGTNLFGPLGQGFMRYWSISQDRGNVQEFAVISNRYARFLIFVVLGVSLILFVLSAFTGWLDWLVLITISLIVGAFTGYFGLRLSVFLAARKRKIVALVNTGTAFLKPFIATVFVVFLVSSADCVMWGYLVSTVVIMYIVEHLYRNNLKDALQASPPMRNPEAGSSNLGREVLTFSWPFCVWGIFGWIHQSCDRWSLQAFHGSDVVGAFSVIALLAVYPLIFASGLLSNLFMPIAYERAGELYSLNAIKSASRLLFVMTGSYVFGALVLIVLFGIFHRVLVVLISNTNYVKFSYLLPALTISWAFFYLGEMLAGFGFLANRPKLYILPKLTSGTIAAISTFYLSSRIGPTGVVWGLGISGFIYAVWCAIIAFRLSSSMSKNI
ncbi:MAG: lipopolysaccharide biosynthesis protein [Desulfobacteraceae bacterium]|nr:lipopolysaccharide biosynthesis protein [Desulfobacteraceae bacterium]